MEHGPTRQWSCSTLLRGASFLAEQRDSNQKMSYDDIVGVAKERLRRLKQMNAPKPVQQPAPDGSTPSPPPRSTPSPPNSAKSAGTSKTAKEAAAAIPEESPAGSSVDKGLGEKADPATPEPAAKTKKASTAEDKSTASMTSALRRICSPKPASGKLEVSMEIYRQWKAGGSQRKCLLDTLKCNGDKEAFKKHVEHLQKKTRRNDVHVDKGFYTKEKMKSELQWSPERIKAAVAFCSDPRRAKTHVRRDKYQPTIKEYWIDIKTTGSYDDDNEESVIDRTYGEGQATSFDLGLPTQDPVAAAGEIKMQPEQDTDQEVEDDGESEGSSKVVPMPGKLDVQKEHALEAIENVGTVMANLLKVQTRMETARDKLKELKCKESQESMSKLEKFRTNLMKYHDELADLKSFFDGHLEDESFDEKKTKELRNVIQKIEVESSRALMEDTKLKKTLLKPQRSTRNPTPKAKGKAKAKAKASTKRPVGESADDAEVAKPSKPPKKARRRSQQS